MASSLTRFRERKHRLSMVGSFCLVALTLLMDPVESLREKRQLTRYLHHAISELEFQRQIELLRILSHKEKDRCLKSSDLLLLQRVILVLKGIPVLLIAFVDTNCFRLYSTCRAGHGCTVPSVQCSMYRTLTADGHPYSYTNNAMYALAATRASE